MGKALPSEGTTVRCV